MKPRDFHRLRSVPDQARWTREVGMLSATYEVIVRALTADKVINSRQGRQTLWL